MATIQRRDPTEEDSIITEVLAGQLFKDIARNHGMTPRQWMNYKKKFPDFEVLVNEALNEYCLTLEQELLHLHEKYDFKTADIYSKNIERVLKYRNPKRYGDKMQMDLQVTVDIAGSLEKAERRVLEATNVIAIESAKKCHQENENAD